MNNVFSPADFKRIRRVVTRIEEQPYGTTGERGRKDPRSLDTHGAFVQINGPGVSNEYQAYAVYQDASGNWVHIPNIRKGAMESVHSLPLVPGDIYECRFSGVKNSGDAKWVCDDPSTGGGPNLNPRPEWAGCRVGVGGMANPGINTFDTSLLGAFRAIPNSNVPPQLNLFFNTHQPTRLTIPSNYANNGVWLAHAFGIWAPDTVLEWWKCGFYVNGSSQGVNPRIPMIYSTVSGNKGIPLMEWKYLLLNANDYVEVWTESKLAFGSGVQLFFGLRLIGYAQ